MTKQQQIDKMTDEALNSLDGADRATARPYLFTRLAARMERQNEGAWENIGRFMARPAVVIAGLCVIIAMNILVITSNNSTAANTSVAEQSATQDEFSTSIASLYDTENTEP